MKLPPSLTLPSGAKVTLRAATTPKTPRARKPEEPLFSEVLALFDDGVVVLEEQDVRDLPLSDFHVLRAVLTKHGFVTEDEIEVACANCGEKIRLRPCAKLEIGPYVDGELEDPELDALEASGVAHDIEGLGVVTLRPRTVRETEPFFAAVAKQVLDITPAVVEALGISGPLAEDVAECDDDAFGELCDLFLRTHYPHRLGAIVFCPKCNARNDVDAPYERELEGRVRETGEVTAVPAFEVFADHAHAIAEPLLASIPGEKIELVIDAGTPAVDDGGEPLLGAYVPPYPGGLDAPSRPPTVTVYYKTFCAIEADEGPYDWEDELEETIEHELEHHVYWLKGDDPMDAAERDEIEREALRVVGKKEAARREIASFGESVADFARRTWPIWLVALAVLLLTLFSSR
jgi:hypothetical protein